MKEILLHFTINSTFPGFSVIEKNSPFGIGRALSDKAYSLGKIALEQPNEHS